MLIACGVAEKKGKVLVCRRLRGMSYTGYWEFPSEEVFGEESLEDTVERAFFDRFDAIPAKQEPLIAFNSSCAQDSRVFVHKVNFQETKPLLGCRWESRWVDFRKLSKYRFFPDFVTVVKEIEKKL